MNTTESCLAIDLGASSGRAIVGCYENSQLNLNEIHRFNNQPLILPDGLHWNVLSLYQEIITSIKIATQQFPDVTSLGIDAWGLDYALLDSQGSLIEIPFHYRDKRTHGIMEQAFQHISRQEIFSATGIQFMEINSLFQLFSQVVNNSASLKSAERLVTIPDIFNYWLTGLLTCEYTEAITTQCYNSQRGEWAWNIIEALGIPKKIFVPVIMPGIILGGIRPELINQPGLSPITVITTASHDTASAAVAIPVQDDSFVYISSGTWSLIGTEVKAPIINDTSLRLNFTNEGGAGNRFLFMKNITGLWLLQECQHYWEKMGNGANYPTLTEMAEQVQPFRALIHPNDPLFVATGDIPERICRRCIETEQKPPQTHGEFVRCILESLALAYKHIIGQIEDCLGRNFNVIHIIGGGSKNGILNQMTANATGKVVIAGPVEATALGNIVIQLITRKVFTDLDEARNVICNSFSLQRYEPEDIHVWDEAYNKWRSLWSDIDQ